MIPTEIIKNHYLKPYSIPKWYKGGVETPMGKSTFFFKDDESKDIVLKVNIKNYEKENSIHHTSQRRFW